MYRFSHVCIKEFILFRLKAFIKFELAKCVNIIRSRKCATDNLPLHLQMNNTNDFFA